MMDYYLLNPAVAGSYDYIPVNLSVRQQWVGFDGAPSSQAISLHYSWNSLCADLNHLNPQSYFYISRV